MSGKPKKEIALEARTAAIDRLFSPSASRNRGVIATAIIDLMPHNGTIIEIASGTGEHVAAFAKALPEVRWAPGDPDEASRRSIAAWTAHLGLANVATPHAIDVAGAAWRSGDLTLPAPMDASADGIVCINMIHIAPVCAAEGLIEGAGRRLAPGGRLFLYGPFARDGAHTAPSNAEFDATLKARNPSWGVRDLEQEIEPLADAAGLRRVEARAMPANNLTVVFEKA